MSSSLSHNLQLYLGNLYSLPRKDMQFLQQICVSSCISTWEESQGDTTIGNTHPGGIRAEQLAPFNLKEAGVLLKAPFGYLSLPIFLVLRYSIFSVRCQESRSSGKLRDNTVHHPTPNPNSDLRKVSGEVVSEAVRPSDKHFRRSILVPLKRKKCL